MGGDLPERLRAIAFTVCDWHAPVNAKAELEQAAAELERLRALESSLPKCWTLIDGKLSRTRAVTPGMVLYSITGNAYVVADVSVRGDWYAHAEIDTVQHASNFADTPEAAEMLRRERSQDSKP